jgi:RNA polymerase sigma-70 factor (ECF subfamily)
VNSALQRARKTVDEKLPEQSQQATLRELGDDALRELVESYMRAMAAGDVDTVVSMLAEDAAWSMPPLSSWYRGHEDLEDFLRVGPLSGNFRWRHRATWASGQPAVGAYTWHEEEQAYLPFALDVLTIEGGRIKEVTAFIARSSEERGREVLADFPDTEPDQGKVVSVFERCGLPARLED